MIHLLFLMLGPVPLDSMPIPPPDPKRLFYLQRTPNTNTIICDVNMKGGVPDPEEPVHVSWIRYTEQGRHAELTYIQRNFAYGIDSREVSPGKFELHFVSYKKYSMYLMRGPDGQYHVYATVHGRTLILKRIYLQISGGSFWVPKVDYVQLMGKDAQTGADVSTRMNV